MKNRIFQLSNLVLLMFFLFSCSKSELLQQAADEKLVELSIVSNSTDPLEYIINGKVVATVVKGNITTQILVATTENKREIVIRKAGSAEILKTKIIQSLPYRQSFSIDYDGKNVYDKSVYVKIKGYAGASTLELLVDDQVLASGTGKQFVDGINIRINEGQTRELQIRKQGETAVLGTKTITSSAGQSIVFYFDGTAILSGIDLTPPVNPLNININAKFETLLPLYYSGPVDLVIFLRDQTGTNSPTSFRQSLPADGSFSANLELPPPPTDNVYTFRIFRSGTTDVVPYNTANDIIPLKFNYITFPEFKAGASQVLILSDTRVSRSTPAALKGTTYSMGWIDIAEYFR